MRPSEKVRNLPHGRNLYLVGPAGITVGIVYVDLHEDAFEATGSAGRGGFWERILLGLTLMTNWNVLVSVDVH